MSRFCSLSGERGVRDLVSFALLRVIVEFVASCKDKNRIRLESQIWVVVFLFFLGHCASSDVAIHCLLTQVNCELVKAGEQFLDLSVFPEIEVGSCDL